MDYLADLAGLVGLVFLIGQFIGARYERRRTFGQ